jgi:endonuclease III
MKRRTSSRIANLVAHASPYSSSVTIYEAAPPLKRVKLEEGTDTPDLEDAPTGAPPRSRKAEGTTPQKRNTSSRRVKVEPVFPDLEDLTPPPKKTPPPNLEPGTSPSPSKKRASKLPLRALVQAHPAPPRWRETYDAIRDMRARVVAPVDTMGCEQAQVNERDPKVLIHRRLLVLFEFTAGGVV